MKYRIASSLESIKFSDELTAEIELFKEGSWKHPSAPSGWFNVTKDRITNFINNFNRKICGPELPLEFSHSPNSEKTPGFITKLYEKIDDGISSLWATLKLADRNVAQRIKNGALKWISPTVVSDYEDTASGQRFEVIRSATLTNYPHIKNLHPIVVNFEEVLNKEGISMDSHEIRKQNELLLRNIEDITLESLTDGDINLEHLSEVQIESLAENFEMTRDQFQEKYPEAGKKGKEYGAAPKIKAPKSLTSEQKKEYIEAFNTAYAKSKDAEKAKATALKRMKAKGYDVELEENMDAPNVKNFVEKFISALKRGVGLEEIDPKPQITDPVAKANFEKQQIEIDSLRAFKNKAEFAEDKALAEAFPKMTPAAKGILQTLLGTGRKSELEFEDKRISVHDLVVLFLQEATKNPTVNLFERISATEKESVDLESKDGNARHARTIALMEKHPDWNYRMALEEVGRQEKEGGQQ